MNNDKDNDNDNYNLPSFMPDMEPNLSVNIGNLPSLPEETDEPLSSIHSETIRYMAEYLHPRPGAIFEHIDTDPQNPFYQEWGQLKERKAESPELEAFYEAVSSIRYCHWGDVLLEKNINTRPPEFDRLRLIATAAQLKMPELKPLANEVRHYQKAFNSPATFLDF